MYLLLWYNISIKYKLDVLIMSEKIIIIIANIFCKFIYIII